MRNKTSFSVLTAIFAGSLFLSSCTREHEIRKKPFKVRTATWYRVSPALPAPIVVNGVTYTSFLNFPGSGTGEASYLGECTVYFNQLAYGTSPEGPPAGSVSAPLTDVPFYPITGAPLPLIQAGDFNQLSNAISLFHIPATVHGKIINNVLINKKGDVIFMTAITGSGSTFPISETVAGFNGKGLIVTGRGKFRHAVGEFDYNGYFSLINPNDAEYKAEGWISY